MVSYMYPPPYASFWSPKKVGDQLFAFGDQNGDQLAKICDQIAKISDQSPFLVTKKPAFGNKNG